MHTMTTTLHLPARQGAAIACDMRSAKDSPDERMRAYDRLFADALRDRERRENAVVFTFGGAAETQARVEELARREADCCPFADYRVEIAEDIVTWTISGDDRAGVEIMLDAYYALPDHPGTDLGGLLELIDAPAGSAALEVRR